jgi:hypothetical protein
LPALLNDIQETLDILQQFDGLASLKKLQAHLNMDREDAVISRRDWKETNRLLLAADPVITATIGGGSPELFAEDQSFKVIYCRLASAELLLTHERAVVAELMHGKPGYPYALFVISDYTQKRFHFLNVKDEPKGQKRQIFRRITVGDGERLRTAAQQLSLLDGEQLKHLTLSQIQQRFDEAFDVGPVTKRFFAEYKRVFDIVKDSITGFAAGDAGEELRNLFTQRLFNRLMFIAFIQKKGWLRCDGKADYLAALWKAHQTDKFENKGTFYAGRLKLLFFEGLGAGANAQDMTGINRGAFLKTVIGEVPYLNGGLFESDAQDDNPKIKVPDKGLDLVINELFEQFNFTITESTPLNIEVAVDPEMLGKIFEELVTGRHESGSYYTPKPIVSFMCREALKGYLETQVPGETQTSIARFIDKHEPDDLHHAEEVLNALRRVTVCDPACGSGAYLLGMLHELLDLRECLFKARKLDHPQVYDRKLEIIQTNIYGVDIAEFAVNIARLRLWLSLAVDFGGDKPEPLPNLDYKIEVGDSVCSPSPGALQMGMQQPLVDELLSLKAKYLRSHHGNKRALREQIEKLRGDIRVFGHRDANVFDWVIEFSEVFANGGFDVTIANPPYVRMELLKDIKVELKKRFPKVHNGRADLYCYFYARAIEMLRPNGMIAFISSNKWLRAAYGAPLRKEISESCGILSITDFGELPVFEEAATFPMIFIGAKGRKVASLQLTQVTNLAAPYPDIQALMSKNSTVIPNTNLDGDHWTLAVPHKSGISANSRPGTKTLAEFTGGRLYRGVVTGLTKAFTISSAERKHLLQVNPSSKRVIKPLKIGDDVRKWKTNPGARWLLYMPHDVDIEGLDAVISHLKPFKKQLEARATVQRWYELQQPQERYAPHFAKPKIVFPDIAKESRFTFDRSGCFISNTAYAIGCDDLYLLAILNSTAVWQFVTNSFSCLGDPNAGGRFRFFSQSVSQIPIPSATQKDIAALSIMVEQCLASNGTDCAEAEAEMNARIDRLYGS